MQILLAVIDDLYIFSVNMVLRVVRVGTFWIERDEKEEIRESTIRGEDGIARVLEPDVFQEEEVPEEDTQEEDKEEQPFKKIDTILLEQDIKEEVLEKEEAALIKNTVMYVHAPEVRLYKNPTREFDTVIARASYGDIVMVLKNQGRWAEVLYGEKQGWILREYIVDQPVGVYPEFTIGEENEADSENTVRLRSVIGDMFNASDIELPLQAGEYVVYRLMRKGLTIGWPETRPRVPGMWHQILRGMPGIHIGVTPKTGSIMEYMLNEEMGHIVYVESVLPDETMQISEVNYPDRGIYNERSLTQEEWREFKPIFIQVM